MESGQRPFAGWIPAALALTFIFWSSPAATAQLDVARPSPGHARPDQDDPPATVRPWPCRLIAEPPLLGLLEDAWQRSATFRRQCEELAAARAVVVLQWGRTDSQSRAVTHIMLHDGVVVARIAVPPEREALEHVAHELQHVIERVRGLDFATESKRRRSGVWRASGGFETQGAIDAGRQVARELADAPRRQAGENVQEAPRN